MRLPALILLGSTLVSMAEDDAAGRREGSIQIPGREYALIVLWNFETELSKRNKGWVLTKDRASNDPLLYHSNWRENPLVAADQRFAIGAIFSSPLIANGVVYFGSTDGHLYALE